MAKEKSKSKDKEWKTENLIEQKLGKFNVWRGQRSTSPDGKTFLGIRKFFRNSEGKELPTKTAITFLEDAELEKNIDAVLNMLINLKGFIGKKGAGKKTAALEKPKKEAAEKPKRKKKGEEDEEPAKWGLYNEKREEYLVRYSVKNGECKSERTKEEDEAKSFETKGEAQADADKYVERGGKLKWKIVRLN